MKNAGNASVYFENNVDLLCREVFYWCYYWPLSWCWVGGLVCYLKTGLAGVLLHDALRATVIVYSHVICCDFYSVFFTLAQRECGST